jgi:hypothetical protein
VPELAPPQKTGAAVAIETIVTPEAAEALAVTSVVAVSATGFAGTPTAANKALNVARIAGAVRCGFHDDALETSAMEVFIVVAVGATKFRYLIGGVITNTAFLVGFAALSLLLHRVAPASLKARRAAAKAWHVLVSYTLATTVGFITKIFFHSDDWGHIIFGGAMAAAWLATYLWALFMVVRRLPTGAAERFDDPEQQAGGQPLYAVYMFADGCRDSRRMRLRVFFFEDVIAAALMSFVASVMPAGDGCSQMAWLILAIAALHAAYVIGLRPYDDPVETAFSIAIGVGQVVLAAAVVWATSVAENSAALTAVGVVALGLFIVFFAQLLILVVMWGYERLTARQKDAPAAAADADGAAAVLVIPLVAPSAPDDVATVAPVVSPRQARSAAADGLSPTAPQRRPDPAEAHHVQVQSLLDELRAEESAHRKSQRPAARAPPPPPPPAAGVAARPRGGVNQLSYHDEVLSLLDDLQRPRDAAPRPARPAAAPRRLLPHRRNRFTDTSSGSSSSDSSSDDPLL